MMSPEFEAMFGARDPSILLFYCVNPAAMDWQNSEGASPTPVIVLL